MPGQDERGTFVLKHRLTGAAILIAFAVMVLPMLLGGPEDPYRDQAGGDTGGDSDTKVFRSNITPIGGATPTVQDRQDTEETAQSRPESPPPASGDGEASEPVQSAGSGEADGGQDKEASETDDVASEVAARDDKKEDQKQEGGVSRGWIVQVGTFKNQENVKSIVDRLEKGGFESSTTEVDTSEGPATRVWVGPYETRVEAARIKTRVKQKTGSEGLIVAYP
jgi:DedD protein